MDVEKAVAYVQAQGDAVERARLAAILSDEPPPKAALQELAALQKANGGFAYWVPEVSNVCDTAFVLQWFDDLKEYRGPIVDPACRFLLDRQQEDGGWDEVEAVRVRCASVAGYALSPVSATPCDSNAVPMSPRQRPLPNCMGAFWKRRR